MQSNIHAGAAEAVITPPVGVDMMGFGGRPSGCIGIHDELYARAVVIAGGDNGNRRRIALVATDLCSLDMDIIEKVREGVAAKTGIDADGLFLNSTHTHHGPVTVSIHGLGYRDEQFIARLIEKIVGTVAEANDRLAEARLFFGKAPVQIGINRRESREGRMVLGDNPEGAVDKEVRVLRVESVNGKPIAAVFNHATHPVCLGGQNLLISADYPGYACDTVRRLLGGGVPMFLQGCCGNINPISACRGTFEKCEESGNQLGEAAVAAWKTAAPLQGSLTPRTVRRNVPLPLMDPPSIEDARATLNAEQKRLDEVLARPGNRGEIMIHEAFVEWAERMLALAEEGNMPRTQDFEIQALALGALGLVGLPGEVFFEYAQQIEAASPFKHNLVLGYHNGCIGYVPTAAEYPNRGYEVDIAIRIYGTLMWKPECEGRIVGEATRLLTDISDT